MLTPRIIKVLIIDDDEDDYFIIANYINSIQANKFTIDLCRSFETGMEKMRARQYDIYFVDYRLGKHTGLELLQQIHSEEFYDPIVLLTGKGNKAVDIQAMMSGATDYLIKSELNTEKLERCIRYSLDRTRSLKEIRARENRYRNLFEGSKDALFIANDQLVMAEVNEAAAALLASPKTELVTQSLYDYIIEEAQKEQLRALIQQNANINDLAVDIRDRGDEIKSCLLSVSLLESPDGSYLLHGIIHDITNIKKVEVANLQAQKLAANERLMRILAHEIRNPLNNISLSIDHFELPYNDTEMQKSLIDIIQRNCIRINHIITELLDLSKPPELNFQSHDLQDILDESIAMTSDRINLRQIEVQKKYPDKPLCVSANKSKLTIAFTNILINAIEAMEPNTGKLTITLSSTGETHNVCIEDNGKGIPEEYLSKLFEPFFTLKKNGIGLGLAASYSIIQSHRANMRVESQVGKGTNFIISFSRNKDNPEGNILTEEMNVKQESKATH